MQIAGQRRKKKWRPVIVAMVTLLAMLVAPVCAPICAAKACGGGTAQTAEKEGCHDAAARHDDAPQGSLGTVKACRSGEFSAILRSPDEEKQLAEVTRNNPAALLYIADLSQSGGRDIANWQRCCDRSNPSEPSDVSVETTNLRI